jgi:hypothetical protein
MIVLNESVNGIARECRGTRRCSDERKYIGAYFLLVFSAQLKYCMTGLNYAPVCFVAILPFPACRFFLVPYFRCLFLPFLPLAVCLTAISSACLFPYPFPDSFSPLIFLPQAI